MSKDNVITQLSQVFRQYGYEGTSLSKISEATGLGRASLYHYFPKGKQEMAATVLDHIYSALEKDLLTPLQGDGKPADRIRAMCQTVREFYNSGRSSCFLDILSIGDAQTLFQSPIRRTLNAWLNTLTQVLSEAGLDPESARHQAENAIIQIQGALVLSRCLGNTDPFERVIENLPETLGMGSGE
ncbi:MAG: TetR/AcrR family transcriptional regulator [Stigonema ocellatum SAG 48.90 = DSM 106950]|nr:TetR/AcrR family transcriptional regulator [Stigonema ocellatum SAG 48.90 = DSM 106950]